MHTYECTGTKFFTLHSLAVKAKLLTTTNKVAINKCDTDGHQKQQCDCQTKKANISRTITDSIEILTANLVMSTIVSSASSTTVSIDDSDNDCQPEMAT